MYLFNFRKIGVLVLLMGFIMHFTACKEAVEPPPLPSSSIQNSEPIRGTFTMSTPDTLQWSEHEFPGLDELPSQPFSLANAPSEPFELETSDSISGEIETRPFDMEDLEVQPLRMDEWPQEEFQFKVSELGSPSVQEAGNLTIREVSSVGVSALETDFGIQGNIYGVMRDSDGMLWFSGSNDITQFDGVKLRTYGAQQGLPINNAFSIYEDSRGLIWVGDVNLIRVLDLDNQLVYTLQTSLKTPLTYHIIEDREGNMWLTHNGLGFSKIDVQNKKITQFTQAQGLLFPFVVQALVDQDGQVWMSSAGGINVLNFEKQTNTLIKQENLDGLVGVANLTIASNGDYWIVTQSGVNIINKDKDEIIYLGPENVNEDFKDLVRAVQDESGRFFIGTSTGKVHMIDWDNKIYQTHTLAPGDNNVVYNLVFDDNEQLWLALATGGGYVLDLQGGKPAIITPQKGLGDANVWGTYQTKDGKFWIGTYNGVDVINLDQKRITHLNVAQGLIAPRNTEILEDSKNRIWLFENTVGVSIINADRTAISQLPSTTYLDDQSVGHILEMPDGRMIMGTRLGKIFVIGKDGTTLRSFQIGTGSDSDRITSLEHESASGFWAATRDNAVYKVNLDDNTIQNVVAPTLFENNNNFALLSNNQQLWIGTYLGLHLLDFADHTTTTFTLKNGLPVNDIYDVVRRADTIYAGTSFGLGILAPEPNEDSELQEFSIRSIGREQGLSLSDFTQNSMMVDDEGRIWGGVNSEALVVINDNLQQIYPVQPTVTGISVLDKQLEFRDNANYQLLSEKDTIWSADNGSFKLTTQYNQNQYLDSLGITYSGVNGPYHLPTDLQLPPDQNFLTFFYNSNQFRDKDKLAYTYFLEGIDKNWSNVSQQTSSETYRDLPHGDYTFYVAAKNIYHDWGEPAKFSFTILPNWWQTWWARLLFFVLLLQLIGSVVRYRSQWLQRENKVLEEKVRTRTQQLQTNLEQLKATQAQLVQSEKMASLGELTAGIAHEIQNPLNFVNNFSELNRELIQEIQEEINNGNMEDVKLLLHDINENEEKIMHHGKRADSIVKGMLQHSRTNSGERLLTDINVLSDEYLRLAYHGLRAKDKSFNATLEKDFDENLGKILIVAQDVGRVILNIINNALQAVRERQLKFDNQEFTPFVKVTTADAAENVHIIIQDNGGGIPEEIREKIFQPFFTTKSAGQGTGLGLSMSYDIIRSHGGEILVNSNEGEGTTFTVILPKQESIN